jgi:hypothetical protein
MDTDAHRLETKGVIRVYLCPSVAKMSFSALLLPRTNRPPGTRHPVHRVHADWKGLQLRLPSPREALHGQLKVCAVHQGKRYGKSGHGKKDHAGGGGGGNRLARRIAGFLPRGRKLGPDWRRRGGRDDSPAGFGASFTRILTKNLQIVTRTCRVARRGVYHAVLCQLRFAG